MARMQAATDGLRAAADEGRAWLRDQEPAELPFEFVVTRDGVELTITGLEGGSVRVDGGWDMSLEELAPLEVLELVRELKEGR